MSDLQTLIFIGGLFLLAIVLTAILRKFKAPGSLILGGIVAGVILGPTILGRMAPTWYEQNVIGGYAEREELFQLSRSHGANQIARSQAGMPQDQQFNELQQERTLEIAAEDKLRQAQWTIRKPVRLIILIAVGMFLLGAGMTRNEHTAEQIDWYAPLSMGLWSAFLPACIGILVFWWLDFSLAECVAAGAALAVGTVMHAVSDHETAERAEYGGSRLLFYTATFASIIAICALGWSLYTVHGNVGFFMLLPAMCILPGRVLPRVKSNKLQRILEIVFIPIITASVAYRVDLIIHFALWPLVVALVISGDGRWFGAWLGAMLCSARKSLRTMRLVLGAMGAATAQLSIAAIGIHAGVIPEPLAYALLLGALLMDATAGTRKAFAKELEEAEAKMDEMTMD